MSLAKAIKDLETETGVQYTKQEKDFALNLVKTGNKSEAARAAGITNGPGQRGYEMANDPEIQRLINEINKYQTIHLTEEFVTNGLMREAITADAPRDRINAYQLLGKTKKLKMFSEQVEQTNIEKSDKDILEDIEKEFGPEAAQKAKEEMGVD